MKSLLKTVLCLLVMVSVQSAAFGQIAYSITDNNRDVLLLDQQYYQFDLATGQGTLISTLTLNGQQIRREYEGLGGTGNALYGMAEYDTEDCNTGSDPITGLAADVRLFRTNGAYPAPNGVPNAIGPQIGEMCIPSGFTEGAGAYNPVDGNLYYIGSDDTLPNTAPRSRIYRVSPTTGLATQIGAGAAAAGIILTTGSGGDQNPYFDGLAILPDGRVFASEARFTNGPANPDPNAADNGGLYRVFISGPNAGRATFVKYLLPTDANRDTGLANNGFLLYLLLEDARVWSTDSLPTSPVTPLVFPLGNPAGSNTLSTPGCLRTTIPGQPFCGDFEGFDIPNGLAGVR